MLPLDPKRCVFDGGMCDLRYRFTVPSLHDHEAGSQVKPDIVWYSEWMTGIRVSA